MHKKPLPIKRIIVLGGGTAGWMSANILARTWINRGLEITVIESKDIGTIGVGEGSTPALRNFFKSMNIREDEWMPTCNATYKCGITFENWSIIPGYERYFHPFSMDIDDFLLKHFFKSVYARKSGLNIPANPDPYFLACFLAKNSLAPIASENFPFESTYGYHFDANLLGKFLKNHAQKLGVEAREGTIREVKLSEQGDIQKLLSDTGEEFTADFFVDCSGFSSRLIQQALEVPFISYKDNLFNDAAVALASPSAENIPSETLATALKCGWAWKIPLSNRVGNGYVYSSEYCNSDEAETELRQHLGILEADVEARHLKMKVGRVEKHWHNNCLAVGLSQGFIEPLEATALMLVQVTLENFVKAYELGNFGNRNEAQFNSNIHGFFDGVRDYIVAHYKTNSRSDSEYWLDNAHNKNISKILGNIFNAWQSSKNLSEALTQMKANRYYNDVSWHCLLAGMGILPPAKNGSVDPALGYEDSITFVKNFIRRCSLNYTDHRQYLEKMKSKLMDIN